MSEDIIFTLLYLLLSVSIIFPPSEFITAGFSISSIFSRYLGSEYETFIRFHMKRIKLTLFIYSILPLGYVVLLGLLGYVEEVSLLFTGTLFWNCFLATSFALPVLALYQIKTWTDSNEEHHPIAVNLSKFSNNTNWQSVAVAIETEYRRLEKLTIQTSTISKIIATENWILKVNPLTMFVAYQSDTTLTVKEASHYQISHQNPTETQFLNIEVKCSRRNVEPFIIRINAMDFKDLQVRVSRTINIAPNVKFHKSVVEQFIDVFKETIQQNPKYATNEMTEQCMCCLQTGPSIKLQKLCSDSGPNKCTACYCRPMWCIDCIAKWFVSRQDNEHQSTWLSAKCTCPMCRATFCILDVCTLDISE